VRFLVALVLAPLAFGTLAGCGSDGSGAAVDLEGKDFVDQTGNSAVTIDAVDNNFRPEYAEISPGTTVTFDNRGRNPHNVLPVEEGAFEPVESEALEPGDTAEVVLDEPGDYAYYC
jgi:plastocyanin